MKTNFNWLQENCNNQPGDLVYTCCMRKNNQSLISLFPNLNLSAKCGAKDKRYSLSFCQVKFRELAVTFDLYRTMFFSSPNDLREHLNMKVQGLPVNIRHMFVQHKRLLGVQTALCQSKTNINREDTSQNPFRCSHKTQGQCLFKRFSSFTGVY